MKETVHQKQRVAVIDIGTSAIRMLVAEITPQTEIRYLENLQKPVRFGKDVFTTGRISNGAMREAIAILRNFKTVTETYGVDKIQAIATSAVREALNRDNFIDRIYVRTGIDVEVLEGPEENRLELIAVEHALAGQVDLTTKNCLIVEVGSGSTEMIILNQGQVEMTRTLSLGSMRLPEKAVPGKTEAAVMQRVLKRSIHEVAVYAAREYNFDQIDTFIALGGDMRFVAQQLLERREHQFLTLDAKAFADFVQRSAKMTPEEIVSKHSIPYAQAETLYPTLLVYANFLAETKAAHVIVPMVSIRDGLLLEFAQMISRYKRTDFSKQVLNSARHLAEKYRYDKAHAACVSSLALKLFDALVADHGMGSKERLLLEVSAILHDIGSYISPNQHHKHSSYLVDAAEIFGLRKAEKAIVSNVVRYHRRSSPRPTHEPYMSLPKLDRAIVSKLSAILRVADALDPAHQQRIRAFTLELGEEAYTLWVGADVGDLTMERSALRDKGDMFADVFGAPIDLKQVKEAAS
ncbi:MAG: HD domain-containing protein [Candidatus Omnitrophica bacterium]|nr:HD domain-containing protein [Candidatus Omnitrophota bacterium]